MLHAYLNALTHRQKKAIVWLAALYVVSWTTTLTGIFDKMPFLDVPFHFLGGFFVVMLFMDPFGSVLVWRGLLRRALVVVSLTVFIGYLWEVHEYILDMFFKDYFAAHSISCCIGNVFDTLKDIAMDGLGAFVAFCAFDAQPKDL